MCIPKLNLSCFSVLVVLLLLSHSLNAEDRTEKLTFLATIELSASTNPEAIATSGEAYYHYIYREDKSPIWKGLYIQSGFQFLLNPAYVKTGLHLEWMPIALFQLRIQYDYFRYFGQFTSLLDFDSAEARYGDSEINAKKGSELTGYANRLSIHPVLRVKFGKIIIRNSFDYYKYQISEERPYFLESAIDILVTRNGRIYSNMLAALYTMNITWAKQSMVGPAYEYTRSIETDLTRQRIGLVAFQSLNYSSKRMSNIRWFSKLAYNLEDRNRENEFYIGIGIGTDINL